MPGSFLDLRVPGGQRQLAASADACQRLKNLRARITYAIGQENAGEIISVELRKCPAEEPENLSTSPLAL